MAFVNWSAQATLLYEGVHYVNGRENIYNSGVLSIFYDKRCSHFIFPPGSLLAYNVNKNVMVG